MLSHLLIGCSLLLACVVGQFEDQPTFLEVRQVQQPPVVSLPPGACNVTLMQHVFANSYGQPFMGMFASWLMANKKVKTDNNRSI